MNLAASPVGPVGRDRAVERLRSLITGFAFAGAAGTVGFAFLAAVTIPGKAQPVSAASATGGSGAQPNVQSQLGSVPGTEARRRHRGDGFVQTVPQVNSGTANSGTNPFFQQPAQNPFGSTGGGMIMSGGS